MKKQRISTPRVRLGIIGAVDQGRNALTAAVVKATAKHELATQVKLYEAIVCRDSSGQGRHASVIAESLDQAYRLLEEQYGQGSVFSLWNKEEAEKPRG
jgi:translation elongation factor EF-Tu-like GTPase